MVSQKWALEQGIAAATTEWLAFTDADCEVSPSWLMELATHNRQGIELVIGLGAYFPHRSILGFLQSYETAYTALQYVGFAQLGMPYMGVGRNLAYRKSFFQRIGGFSAFQHRLSGDDDLLVNAYATADNTSLLLSWQSWTYSAPKTSWRDWIRQKMRHVSASPAYKWQTKSWLSLLHLSHLLFYVSFLLSLWLYPTNLLPLLGYIIRVGLSWGVWMMLKPRLQGTGWIVVYPLLDFLFFLYNLTAVPIGMIIKPSWTKKPKSQKTQKRTGS